MDIGRYGDIVREKECEYFRYFLGVFFLEVFNRTFRGGKRRNEWFLYFDLERFLGRVVE